MDEWDNPKFPLNRAGSPTISEAQREAQDSHIDTAAVKSQGPWPQPGDLHGETSLRPAQALLSPTAHHKDAAGKAHRAQAANNSSHYF